MKQNYRKCRVQNVRKKKKKKNISLVIFVSYPWNQIQIFAYLIVIRLHTNNCIIV